MADIDYLVTVCAECLQASCWHGENLCQAAVGANITVLMASTLRALRREHGDNFSPAKIARVHGRFPAARMP